MDTVIIGAGIVGLGAAARLLQDGHHIRVHGLSPQLGEVRAVVQMGANAVKVLDHLRPRPTLDTLGMQPKPFEFRRGDDGALPHRMPLPRTRSMAVGRHLRS
jgi:2-polyprenyl-6-methoxyphenol hydroxylase-like FAD-dependent oxidoreductase